jgi:hypothetical protein
LHSPLTFLIFGAILPKNKVDVYDYLPAKMHGAGGRVHGEYAKEFISAEKTKDAEDLFLKERRQELYFRADHRMGKIAT